MSEHQSQSGEAVRCSAGLGCVTVESGMEWAERSGRRFETLAEGVTLILADCREALPALKMDAMITDPPYGVGLDYNGFDDTPEYVLPMMREVIAIGLRNGKRVVVTPGVRNVWKYPEPSHTGSFFYPAGCGVNAWGFTCWQPILFYGNDPYRGKGSRPDSKESFEGADKNGHPCPKPVGQWSWLVNRASLEGEMVCDPFMGSGTGAIACLRTGRRFVGIERNEAYFEIAVERVRRELAQGVLPLVGGGGAERQGELLSAAETQPNESSSAAEPKRGLMQRTLGDLTFAHWTSHCANAFIEKPQTRGIRAGCGKWLHGSSGVS